MKKEIKIEHIVFGIQMALRDQIENLANVAFSQGRESAIKELMPHTTQYKGQKKIQDKQRSKNKRTTPKPLTDRN